jgi:transcriptional regulator with XRE-family HTH domain
MTLGTRLKQRRVELKITQKQLADSLNVTPQHISAIEQDKRVPSLSFLTKLSEELGTTIDYLIAGKAGIVTDSIAAIKADKTLSLESKKALISLIKSLRQGQ